MTTEPWIIQYYVLPLRSHTVYLKKHTRILYLYYFNICTNLFCLFHTVYVIYSISRLLYRPYTNILA